MRPPRCYQIINRVLRDFQNIIFYLDLNLFFNPFMPLGFDYFYPFFFKLFFPCLLRRNVKLTC